jgi:hypothetical protein
MPVKKKFKYQNANKITGILLRPFKGDPAIFRIYGKKGSFKDYEIRHDDVRVKIMDDSVEFIESMDGKDFYLDYSRKTLGQWTKYDRKELPKKKNMKGQKVVEKDVIRYKTIEAFGKDLGLTQRQMELIVENKKLQAEVDSLQRRLKGTNQILAGEVEEYKIGDRSRLARFKRKK